MQLNETNIIMMMQFLVSFFEFRRVTLHIPTADLQLNSGERQQRRQSK